MTPLDKSLKRSLRIASIDYVLTLNPESLKITRKGRRLGLQLKWADLTSGESALAVALQASVGQLDSPKKDKDERKADFSKVSAATRTPQGRPVQRLKVKGRA